MRSIVDDERLATKRASASACGASRCRDRRRSGEHRGRREVAARRPVDVLLLDIQMPGGTGFDLLERLERCRSSSLRRRTTITRSARSRSTRFDYLMKPIRADRLAAALAKVRMTRSAGRRPMPDRVFLRDGERSWIVAVADIVLFEAEGNYARACFGKSVRSFERRFRRSSRVSIRPSFSAPAAGISSTCATSRPSKTASTSRTPCGCAAVTASPSPGVSRANFETH